MPNPTVNEMLGRAKGLLQANRLSEARDLYREICRLHQGDPATWLTLGALHGQLGDPVAAETCARHAIALRPDLASAHFNLGVSLREQRKLPDAAAAFRTAIQFSPGAAEAHNALAFVLAAQGQLGAAEEHFQQAIRLNPGFADAHNNLGNVLQAAGRKPEALMSYRRAVESQPDHLDAMRNLASLLASMGRIEEAIEWDRRILALHPDAAGVHYHLGNLLLGIDRLEEAVECFRSAHEIKPDFSDARGAEAVALQKLGRLDESWTCIAHALEHGDHNPAILSAASALAKQLGRQGEFIRLAEDMLESASLSREERQQLHFAAGRLHDETGRYPRAFEHFQRANSLYQNRFMRIAHESSIRSSIALFQPFRHPPLPRAQVISDLPVFIVGMPRSGTSLVEQILASHPRVHGGGELNDINQYANDMQARLDSPLPYPDCLRETPQAIVDELATRYLDRLRTMDTQAGRVTDKMPHNFLHLGMIAMLFPAARIIHVRRQPLDTCLSIYCQPFNELHAYAHDLSDLGFYYRCYERLMAHWRSTLTMPMLEIQYEDLVRDPVTWIPRLVEFCELEWDDRCMRFHETRRTVNTPSSEQVREPMYSRSIDRWKHYEAWLEPLRIALEDDPE